MIKWVLYTKKGTDKLWEQRGKFPDIVRGVNEMVRAALRIGAEEGQLVVKVELVEEIP